MYGKRIVVIIVVVVLLGAGYYGYTQYIAQEPEVAPPETVEEGIPDVVSATGVVMPARWANLSFQTGGRVEEISVETGDEVKEGQLLARLDATALERQVAQAQAGLATARARLAQVRAGVRPEEIEAAEAGLAAAQAGLKQAQGTLASAQANLDKLLEEPTKARLAAAEAALKAAEDSYQRVLARPEPEDIRQAKLNLDQAKNSLWAAQAERDSTCGAASKGMATQAQCDGAKAQVLNAEVAVQLAEVAYQEAQKPATTAEIENAAAQVERARDEWERLRDGPTEAEVAAAEAQVAQAQGGLEVAQAQVAQAEAQLAALEAGPTPEEIALAEAQVEEAEAALAQAQAALEETNLFAPFDGTVGEVLAREGEIVGMSLGIESAGGLTVPIVVLGDLTILRVETTDLNEVDIAKVKVGQEVEITFDALPERKLTGQVARIAPKASLEQGGTNYTLIIELDEQDPDLRWGMTAFVDIIAAEE
jgi:HlyD family secretion protein